jgi:tetratricopeptide (TPR) repeat protein
MSKITLRAYIQQIDNLIESGKNDEAILICNHILKSFPKHIDTYRLLGKTFLESKQYENADLVFKQVLMVYPDDFISHLGLSYIFETRSEFSTAVDHMERAFELQPANPTIQDELKRLYKARDGVEPVRVRLTRGALIKMYARSNLFSQAIAEIRVALNEHSDRFDLEVTLAKMLIQSRQNIEAVECCLNIISKYPFCFDANLILVQTLKETAVAKDVNVFQNRLIELDPYYKFVSKERPDVYSIPDIAVSIDERQNAPSLASNLINWKTFITDSWIIKSESVFEENKDEEINWDEIIEKHFESTNLDTLSKEKRSAEEETQTTNSDKKPDFQEHLSSQSVENEPSFLEQEQLPQQNVDNEFTSLISPNPESFAEWVKIEDQPDFGEDTNDSRSDLKKEEFENEESGFVDHDAPALFKSKEADPFPPSVWIQDTPNSEKDDEQEIIKCENSKGEKDEQDCEDVSHSDQYFEVVLKDAHDALLSGYSQRAIDGYRLLLQENKMNELATKQLEDDLINYPNVFDLWIILGDSYHRLGLSTKALESYQQAEKQLGNSKGENV